ncbi:hypothetical protein [Streptomyces oceani]|uniref:hypothetical protein n=1 Tax=Streptomyces oceani TaxID=1075402 RepID=UPI00147B0DB6|nr:hypothetical protein [Streptomyces oceani]
MARTRKRLIRASVLPALAALAFTGTGVLAAPAYADVEANRTWYIRTTDGDPGGSAWYSEGSNRFEVCDIDADGYRAVGWLNGNRVDAAGSAGTCKERKIGLPDGMNVKMTVCLKSGANGTSKACRSEWVRA